jgi:DNA-binding NtrC family response regulator
VTDADLQAALSNEGGLKEHVKVAMSRLERDLVSRALQQTNGNVTHAARLLKISRKGLQLKMKELGLREPADGAFAPGATRSTPGADKD